jgi:hypothetical protein
VLSITDLPAQRSGISESESIQDYHRAQPESPLRDTPKFAVSPLAWIHLARGVHARLIEAQSARDEKLRLAREVEGALFTAESKIRVSNRARLLFFRLRTYAHLTAKRGSHGLRHNATTWMHYDELELLVEKAMAAE